MKSRLALRPAATSSFSAVTFSEPRSRVKPSSPYATDATFTPTRTSMPSASNAFASRSEASGSSTATSRSATSTTVTSTPNRANTCANSQPIGPPPSTIRDFGSSVSATASRLVQYGVPCSPSIGGAAGAVPVFSTTPLRATYVVSPTRTRPGPSRTPRPRANVAPLSSSRLTATASSQSSVASSRIRRATGPQSGCTLDVPPKSETFRASATTWAAAIIIFDGTHP